MFGFWIPLSGFRIAKLLKVRFWIPGLPYMHEANSNSISLSYVLEFNCNLGAEQNASLLQRYGDNNSMMIPSEYNILFLPENNDFP
jgi:hypothetical protein